MIEKNARLLPRLWLGVEIEGEDPIYLCGQLEENLITEEVVSGLADNLKPTLEDRLSGGDFGPLRVVLHVLEMSEEEADSLPELWADDNVLILE